MTIKIYSTPTCTYCQAAKDLFKSKNAAYTEVDVAADVEQRKHMIDISGQMGVPVIEIDGSVIVGFNEELLLKKLSAVPAK